MGMNDEGMRRALTPLPKKRMNGRGSERAVLGMNAWVVEEGRRGT